MASSKHQSAEILNQSSLKINAIKFLVPVSVFSVLSYLTFILLIVQVSTQIDKNYMFLLCNGILVLIAKNSGLSLITNDSQQETDQVHSKNEQQRVVDESSEKKAASVAVDKAVVELDNAEDEEEEVNYYESFDDDDEEEEEEEEEEGIQFSIEELNKKCEEFIRKMKAEIKYEA